MRMLSWVNKMVNMKETSVKCFIYWIKSWKSSRINMGYTCKFRLLKVIQRQWSEINTITSHIKPHHDSYNIWKLEKSKLYILIWTVDSKTDKHQKGFKWLKKKRALFTHAGNYRKCCILYADWTSGPGCSKLTTSLVNVSLKFEQLISQICQYFLLKKMRKAFALQKLLSFFQQKISVYLVIKL